MLNLKPLLKKINNIYGVTEEMILSKNKTSDIVCVRAIICKYLYEKKKISISVIAKNLNLSRKAVYNLLEYYDDNFLSYENIENFNVKKNNLKARRIFKLIEENNIKGKLKKHLLSYLN